LSIAVVVAPEDAVAREDVPSALGRERSMVGVSDAEGIGQIWNRGRIRCVGPSVDACCVFTFAAVSQGCRFQNDKRLDGLQRLYGTMEYAPLNAGNLRNLLGKVILTKRIFANIDENESIGR
jgi:hypothetical protein